MTLHKEIVDTDLRKSIRNNTILLAGNNRLNIYGKLSCLSGKRMKKENRIFFKNETEAIQLGFRPCGHCLRKAYVNWKLLS